MSDLKQNKIFITICQICHVMRQMAKDKCAQLLFLVLLASTLFIFTEENLILRWNRGLVQFDWRRRLEKNREKNEGLRNCL